MNKSILTVLLLGILLCAGPSLGSASEPEDVYTRIETLEKQIQGFQSELTELRTLAATKDEEQQLLVSKIEELEAKPPSFLDRGFSEGEGFRLQDALGLEEESAVNIGGEITMRYRENEKTDAGENGFQFYEIELFVDASLHENLSLYIEYNLIHAGNAEAEDAWIDFHTAEGPLAFAGGTGLKLGNFHYPFGWDNDDEEGYVYGGRTSVNSALIRNQRVDGWRLRERQVGLAGYYNVDLIRDLNVSAVLGVFNGSGDVNHATGAYDNDRDKDVAGRIELKYKDFVFGASGLFAPHTGTVSENVNNTDHVRDISRWGVHFKYPDVTFPGQDVSIGGKPVMVWGEALWGANHGNTDVAAFNTTQNLWGGYLEADVSITPQVLGFIRGEYYDSNTDVSDDGTYAITPGIRLGLFNSSTWVLEYEFYGGGNDASNSITDDDRFATQWTTQF
jgi:hypothetical protein